MNQKDTSPSFNLPPASAMESAIEMLTIALRDDEETRSSRVRHFTREQLCAVDESSELRKRISG